MPKHLIKLEVYDHALLGNYSVYSGRLVKINSTRLENNYKLSLIAGDTHEEIMSELNSRKSRVKSKFGNGEYKFTASNGNFKLYWVEFMGENYKLPVSNGQFEYELACLNHNRLQISQVEDLKRAVEVLKAQGLRSEARRIEEILLMDRNVRMTRYVKLSSISLRKKLIGR